MAMHTTTSELSVAIIGAGIGGVAAAVALQQQGIHAEIYEQATALREVGAAVTMSPPTVRLFQQWGIADRFAQQAVRIHWMHQLRAIDGELLQKMRIPVRTDDPGENWMDVTHRADLHNLLLAQVPPASIHLGHKAQTVLDHEDHAEIRFVDGSSVRASLVIGADGIHSVVRPLISSDTPIYSGSHVYRGMVSRENTFGLIPEDVIPTWVDATRTTSLLPMRAGTLVSIDIYLPSPDSLGESWSTTASADYVIEKMAGFQPALLQIVRHIEGPIGDRALFDRAPLDHWSMRHITLLGDAAHPMLPAQGQGANMAIEDAAVLADILRGADIDGIPEVLQGYEAKRKPITSLFQEKSREFATKGPEGYKPFEYEKGKNPSDL